jgi:hypothetical protein
MVAKEQLRMVCGRLVGAMWARVPLSAPGSGTARTRNGGIVPLDSQRGLGTQAQLYAQAGAPWYWIVDPEADEITVLENVCGLFRQRYRLSGSVSNIRKPLPLVLDLPEIVA